MGNSTKITPNLTDTGKELLFLGLPVPTVRSFGNIFFVNTLGGNDTTGQKGRFDKPFATVPVALAAANIGDVIYVYPGTYSGDTNGEFKCGVSSYVHMVCFGATLNGNVNINNNAYGGVLSLNFGSKVNGSIRGTFGSITVGDGSAELNGQIGTNGDNGGHSLKGLRKWTLADTCYLNLNSKVEDIDLIESTALHAFIGGNFAGANQAEPTFRNIRHLKHTHADSAGAVFSFINANVYDRLINIDLIESVNGRIFVSIGRAFHIRECNNVTFKQKVQSDAASMGGAYRNCRFISDARFAEIGTFQGKFIDCQFQAVGTEVFKFTGYGNNANTYLEYIKCVANQTNFYNNAAASGSPTRITTSLYTAFPEFKIIL